MPTSRRSATKARLVRAAISEFALRGIDGTSVEQLCEAAGFTRGAFYSNFESKDDLCIEVTRRIATDAAQALRSALFDIPDELDRDDMVRYLFATQEPGMEVRTTQMELELRAHRDPGFSERFREARADLWPAFYQLAEEAAARAKVEFLIDIRELMFIYEAIYYYPGGEAGTERTARLLTVISRQFTRPLKDGSADTEREDHA